MSKIDELEHEFVTQLPDEPRAGVIYISMQFGTAVHLCCCGCRNQVFTPLRPNRWRLAFDGETISLCPSVGNWNFPCESHYWITHGTVRWATRMTQAEIHAIRERSREDWVSSREHQVTLAGSDEGATTAAMSGERPLAEDDGVGVYKRLLRRLRSRR